MTKDRDKAILLDTLETHYNIELKLILMRVMSVFEWEYKSTFIDKNGIENTLYIDPWYIEKTLLRSMKIGFYKLKDTNTWMASDFIYKGLTPYGYPTDITGFTLPTNGQQSLHEVEGDYWEMCYDNNLHTSFYDVIDRYARMLAKIRMVMNQNLFNQISPKIVKLATNEKGLLPSYKKLFNEVEAFANTIYTSLPTEQIEVLDLQTPFLGLDLETLYERVWDRCMLELGINTSSDKRERIITDEAAMDREETSIVLASRLNTRKELCKKLQERFGMEIDVTVNNQTKEERYGSYTERDFEEPSN